MRLAKLTKNPLFYLCLVLFFVLAFQIFNFVALAFREPTQPFPGDTPAAPLDTSSNPQTKDGNLIINGSLGVGATPTGARLYVFGPITATGNVTARAFVGDGSQLTALSWSALTGFPSACPSGQAVTAVGSSSLTCAAVGSSSQWKDISSGGGIYYNGGSVGISTSTTFNTFSTSTYTLYVDGIAAATGGWESVSDARLKTNVQELNGALQKILRLRGVSFNWLNGNQAPQIGLIAQEVEKEFPELVTTASDGYKSLAYDRLTAVLLEAIKEQQKQIETLSARLKALEENTSR